MYCNRMRCYVGPAFCKYCKARPECSNPVEKEKTNDIQARPKRVELTPSERLCKRRKALAMVERRLQDAYLYAGTGFALHTGGEQEENVLPSVSNGVASEPSEDSERVDEMLSEIPCSI